MSQENVEIVRVAYERLNAGDVEGCLEHCDPDIEFRDLPALPGSGVHRGHEGVRAWVIKLNDAFADLRFEVEELFDAGDNVVMTSRAVGQGRESGAAVDLVFFLVATMSGGKIATLVAYEERADAFAAAPMLE